ncbi:MAG: glycosyltransferase family 2 protein, partial [Syntrophaceae bacterium]|nr:glycosyltransferase family 2 protein [Syntrophaceae bacterium]
MKWNAMNKLLTIAVPTYNRADKVKRLLSVIKDEIFSFRLQDQVSVIVSNNASTDKTHSAVSKFLNCGLNIEYYRQPENLGFDGNLRFLYTQAKTRYVWYISDDEMPLKGAISKILKVLKKDDPDVLLFSFIQPPGSTVMPFDYPEAVRIISDPVSAIKHVLRYTKLSIFVIRKFDFDSSHWSVLDANLGAGWYYILLAFSVLQISRNLRLAIISEPLGTCDEDYIAI